MEEIKKYHDNGQLKEQYHMNDLRCHGEYKEWNENGILVSHKNYIEGDINGECKLWYDNGTLKAHKHYQFGNLNGECKWWYENGQIATEVRYVDDHMVGEYKSWFRDGTPFVFAHYDEKTGMRHGEYKRWYANGNLYIQCNYVNGKKHGGVLKFDESGEIIESNYLFVRADDGGGWKTALDANCEYNRWYENGVSDVSKYEKRYTVAELKTMVGESASVKDLFELLDGLESN